MTAPRDEVLRKVRQWMAYADEDLQAARHLLDAPGERPCRLVAYHAQQCAEKSLKAYLVHREVDFPYTHNMSVLLEFCSEFSDWPAALADAEKLTEYAIVTRYPGAGREISEEEAGRAVGIAVTVQQRVREALAEEGVSL